MSYWGTKAREYWQRHLPERYAALDDPDQFFKQVDEDVSAYYQAVRDSLLKGVNPNDGTITGTEFLAKVAQADKTAHEIVSHELLYMPGEQWRHKTVKSGRRARRRRLGIL